MIALAFDSYKAVKALREARANESWAEAAVATVGDAIGENVATNIDIAEAKTDMASEGARLYRTFGPWLPALSVSRLRY